MPTKPAQPFPASLHRRTFLRGMGAMVALPFFESLMPAGTLRAAERAAAAAGPAAAAASGPYPLRTAFVYVPNGVDNANWWPTGEGANYTMGRTLASLEPYKGDMQIISGLDHYKANANGDGGGDHARAGATFLTGCQAYKTGGRDIHVGISVDQMIANKSAQNYRLPSLELSCDAAKLTGVCDTGYSCAYQYNLSWRSATQPNPAERNPRLVFERMFGAAADGMDLSKERRLVERTSILDFVQADARQLQSRLGRSDQQKLDEYFSALREIERRITSFEAIAAANPDMPAPTGVPPDYDQHMKIMMDLVVLAFQTNSTPVATLMLASESSGRTFANLGISDGHHSISHHMGNRDKLAQIQKIDEFYAQQFAYLVGKMKSVKEGDGTLLDHCLVQYGSCIRDGNKHDHTDLPIVLAGRAGGAVKTGRFNVLEQSVPMTNLYMMMMDLHGASAERLGDSTGRLSLAS